MVSLWSVPAGHLWLLCFFAFAVHYRHFGYGTGSFQLFPNHAAGHVCHMFFFVIIIMLMSGLITPINSMPEAWPSPHSQSLKYFIQVTRMVYLKESGFDDLIVNLLPCFFALWNGWAVFSYKRTHNR